jgi:hypothetical protein
MTQEKSRGGGSAAGKIRRGDLGKESRAGKKTVSHFSTMNISRRCTADSVSICLAF